MSARALSIKYFILAGGIGERAKPLSQIKPKPVFPLDGQPLISRLLGQLRRQGINSGFINLHHLPEQIPLVVGADAAVRFFYEEKLSGSRILAAAADEEFDLLLVVNGDIWLDIPVTAMVEKLRVTGAQGVLLVRRDATSLFPKLCLAADRFLQVGDARDDQEPMYTGVALFGKEVVERIAAANFFDTLRLHRWDIRVLFHDGLWLDLGTPRSYFQANFLFRKFQGKNEGNALSAGVTISPDSRIVHSVLWENSEISGGTNISSCIITGNLALSGQKHDDRIVTRHGIFSLS